MHISALDVLTYVRNRLDVSAHTNRHYQNKVKGTQGEQALYQLLRDKIPSCYTILTDLISTCDGTEFQIDILVIGENTIFPLEVKNYEGNFIIQNDNWYTVSSNTEIRNPLHQLKRMEILLGKLLQQGNFQFSIQPYVLFVHPAFYLYQVPLHLPLVFPTQINGFIRSFQASFQPTTQHQRFIQYLENKRKTRSAHERLPEYTYEQLRKGIVCLECWGFLRYYNYKKVICPRCKKEEALVDAVKRSVVEFKALFPDHKITTPVIQDWCAIIPSTKTIRRLLKTFATPVGNRNHRHYVMRG